MPQSSRTIIKQIGISEYQSTGFSNDFRPEHRYVSNEEAAVKRHSFDLLQSIYTELSLSLNMWGCTPFVFFEQIETIFS